MFRKIFLGVTGLSLILTILFLILKLTNVINWRWIFVFMPVILYCVALILFCIMSILMLASEDDEYYKVDDKNE